jgi:Tfp pilus assembly protein FimT
MGELMVSMGIFTILLAIAVPGFVAQQPTRQLSGAARLVLAELMSARAKAVEENNQYVVSFPTSTGILILDDNNNDGTADAGESTRSRSLEDDYPGVTISKNGGDPDPIFSPRGTAAGATTITVANSSGSRTVTVGLTGVVKIN